MTKNQIVIAYIFAFLAIVGFISGIAVGLHSLK